MCVSVVFIQLINPQITVQKSSSYRIRSLQCLFTSVLVLFNVKVQKMYVETRRSRPLWIKSRDLRIMCWYSVIKGKVERAVRIILITVLCLLRNWCFEYKRELPAFVCGLSPTKLCSTYSTTLSGRVKTKWFNLLEAKLHSSSWRYIRIAKRAAKWIKLKCVCSFLMTVEAFTK